MELKDTPVISGGNAKTPKSSKSNISGLRGRMDVEWRSELVRWKGQDPWGEFGVRGAFFKRLHTTGTRLKEKRVFWGFSRPGGVWCARWVHIWCRSAKNMKSCRSDQFPHRISIISSGNLYFGFDGLRSTQWTKFSAKMTKFFS